jgi:hypothetical protein
MLVDYTLFGYENKANSESGFTGFRNASILFAAALAGMDAEIYRIS